MAKWSPREGRRQAKENLGYTDGGDCARCGGDKTPSTLPGFLVCQKCSYEWRDPDYVGDHDGQFDSVEKQSEKVAEFKRELESGTGLARVLGIESELSDEQNAGLNRLQSKWFDGMQGHFNPAEEERKPLMISFDDDDNLLETQVGAVHLSDNNYDGGEVIRLEYPGYGTEFYGYNEDDTLGWRRGRTLEETARNIASIINKRSKLVHARHKDSSVCFELRSSSLEADSLVIFVDDPGGKNMVAEKLGVILDPDEVQMYEDYHQAVQLVVADGIITPSEDQLLWAMRQNLGISDSDHIRTVMDIFGEEVSKECPDCGSLAALYQAQEAWWCEQCQLWL
jgi:ribosomal protein L37AE/L43A